MKMGIEELIFSHEWLLFYSVCETSSLKVSAERFKMSTSAASRSLKRLEESLGITLFDRCSKPMVLTQSGQTLYRQLRPMMKTTHSVLESLREENFLHADLRIGFLDSMASSMAPHFLSNLNREFGTITCLTGSSDRLIERLKHRDLDIILSSDPALKNPDWKRLLLIKEPSIAIFPKDIGMDFSIPLTWSKLSLCNLPFINSYGKSGRGKLINNFLITYGIQLTGKINADSLSIKLSMVADHNGWSITSPLSLFNYPNYLDKVRYVKLPPPGLERKIYLIAHEDITQSLFAKVGAEICKIYKTSVLPELKKITPQDADSYFVQNVENYF